MALIFNVTGQAQNGKKINEYLNVPGPITFGQKAYSLSWSSHPTAAFYKQEYLVKGDSAEKFHSMLLIDVTTNNAQIKEVVAAKLDEIKQIKAGNPLVTYESFGNASTGEYMIDFMLTANDGAGKLSIAERSLYRYVVLKGKPGKSGVLLFGISHRAYGNDIQAFISSAKTNKSKLQNELLQFKMPAVVIK